MFTRSLDLRAREVMFSLTGDRWPNYSIWFYLNCAYFVIPGLSRLSRVRNLIIKDYEDAIEGCDDLMNIEEAIKSLENGLREGLILANQAFGNALKPEFIFINGKIDELKGIFRMAMDRRAAKVAIQNGDYRAIERNIDNIVFCIDLCIYPLARFFCEVTNFLKKYEECRYLALRTNRYSEPLARLGDVNIDIGEFSYSYCDERSLYFPVLPYVRCGY